jgi:hypothetical protein
MINRVRPAFPNNWKNALESFDVNGDDVIDYTEFLLIEKRYFIGLGLGFRLGLRISIM